MKEIIELYKTGFELGVKLKLHGKPRCAGNSVAFSFDVVMKDVTISPIDVFELNAGGKVQHMRAYYGPENVSQVRCDLLTLRRLLGSVD